MMKSTKIERITLGGYGDNVPPPDLLHRFYAERHLVAKFNQIDSDSLEFTTAFEAVHRASHADGGTINKVDSSRTEKLPVVRIQILDGASVEEIGEAMDLIWDAIKTEGIKPVPFESMPVKPPRKKESEEGEEAAEPLTEEPSAVVVPESTEIEDADPEESTDLE